MDILFIGFEFLVLGFKFRNGYHLVEFFFLCLLSNNTVFLKINVMGFDCVKHTIF